MQARRRQPRSAKKVGAIDLADAVFGAEVKEHLFWEVVKAQRAAQARRHAQHQDARRGPRRRQEALQAEGHRQRAPGLDAARRTASAAAWSSARSPRDYAYTVPQKVRAAALALGAVAARARRRSWSSSTVRARRAQDQDARRRPQGAGRRRRRWSSTARATTTSSSRSATCRKPKFLPPEGVNVYDILRHDTWSSPRTR